MSPILVSACLLGINVRFDGGHNADPRLIAAAADGLMIPVCPEQLGGLTTPRPPAELQLGDGNAVLRGTARVITRCGRDVTTQFLAGAQEVCRFARFHRAIAAILKERSPSCGCFQIYDGSFSGQRRPGPGVATALLQAQGIAIYSEEVLNDALLRQLLEAAAPPA